jgi:hypothetical protein
MAVMSFLDLQELWYNPHPIKQDKVGVNEKDRNVCGCGNVYAKLVCRYGES